MPRQDGTGPMGQGGRTGRGNGQCGGQGVGAGAGAMGGRRRRLRNGMGAEQASALVSGEASTNATQHPGQEVAELKEQVRQLTEAVQALAQKMNEPQKPASPRA